MVLSLLAGTFSSCLNQNSEASDSTIYTADTATNLSMHPTVTDSMKVLLGHAFVTRKGGGKARFNTLSEVTQLS